MGDLVERDDKAISFETRDGEQHVTIRGKEALEELFGTSNDTVSSGLLAHCISPLSARERSNGSEDMRGFMAETVREIAPRDAIERMLAVQMAATHVAIIRQGQRMAWSEGLPQFEAAERAYNKLARTYTAQMEALRKHRHGGKQTVTVQHVNIADGGQAIVGNVKTGGRGKNEK